MSILGAVIVGVILGWYSREKWALLWWKRTFGPVEETPEPGESDTPSVSEQCVCLACSARFGWDGPDVTWDDHQNVRVVIDCRARVGEATYWEGASRRRAWVVNSGLRGSAPFYKEWESDLIVENHDGTLKRMSRVSMNYGLVQPNTWVFGWHGRDGMGEEGVK